MKYSQQWLATLDTVPAGDLSALRAMLYFDRTGERLKPRLVVENAHIRSALSRARLRLIAKD